MSEEKKVLDFPKKENQTEIEIVNQNYRLGEMAEAMEQSIVNAKTVAKEQAALIDIISKSDRAKEFTELMKSCENQIDNINAQVVALSVRASLLKKVLDVCNKDENTSQVVAMLLKALGVFEKN